MEPADEPATVLVVDDDELLLWLAADLLESKGYRVLEASDAASALAILDRVPGVRLLFTDVQMPGNDDRLALAQKVYDRWPNILLLVTSGGMHLNDQDVPDHGRFLPKPYSASGVVNKVASMIADQDQAADECR